MFIVKKKEFGIKDLRLGFVNLFFIILRSNFNLLDKNINKLIDFINFKD